jgi:integrase
MAKVRKRRWEYPKGSGNWKEAWVVDYTDSNGAPRLKTARPNTRDGAVALRKKIEREVEEGIHLPDSDALTFGEVARRWLSRCDQRTQGRNPDLKVGSVYAYRLISKNHVIPRFGSLKVNKIQSRDVQGFVDQLLVKHAAKTAHSIYLVIWNVFEFAVSNDLLPDNPLKRKRVVIPPARKRQGEEIPEYDDVMRLLRHLCGPRPETAKEIEWANTLVLVTLAAFGGLRAGECRGLEFEDIDLDARDISIERQITPHDAVSPPKFGSYRKVPINPILHKVITDYIGSLGRSSGRLFMARRGGAPYSTWIDRKMRQVMLAAGITSSSGEPKFTFHALRHFAGSAWLAEGMRIQDVSWNLGHKDIKTTMRIYAHQLKEDDHAREVINGQFARFPGIPYSVPALPAPSAPVLLEGVAVAQVSTTADKAP